MSALKFVSVLIAVLFFVSRLFTTITFAQVSQDQAASALANADSAVTLSYQAALKAEDFGANVSSLLVRLNDAGGLLSRAHLAYNSGDFDSAQRLAAQSQEKLNGFVAEANALRETAIHEYYMDFIVNIIGSVLGAISIVCIGFFVWFLLKRKYEKAGR
jgi:hypothetical protein